jgi:ubiquinone/menaquinone biosynthesis C-methylase UbiE
MPNPESSGNVDAPTVSGFGDEWSRFNQQQLLLNAPEHLAIFNSYFAVFPWQLLPEGAVGFDLGCGTGRWAALVAQKVGHLHCIDPSEALEVARRNLAGLPNCFFHRATVDKIPLPDNSADFGYSLGVLHHVPDTRAGICQCVQKLKSGAPLLLYLYYAFDNKPAWFRLVWWMTEFIRFTVSRLPHPLRYAASQVLACLVYFPAAKIAAGLERMGRDVRNLPLSAYRSMSFYTMRTDALDRFGTRLEQRFTKAQIKQMMEDAGLTGIRFSDAVPYWCAVGLKK